MVQPVGPRGYLRLGTPPGGGDAWPMPRAMAHWLARSRRAWLRQHHLERCPAHATNCEITLRHYAHGLLAAWRSPPERARGHGRT